MNSFLTADKISDTNELLESFFKIVADCYKRTESEYGSEFIEVYRYPADSDDDMARLQKIGFDKDLSDLRLETIAKDILEPVSLLDEVALSYLEPTPTFDVYILRYQPNHRDQNFRSELITKEYFFNTISTNIDTQVFNPINEFAKINLPSYGLELPVRYVEKTLAKIKLKEIEAFCWETNAKSQNQDIVRNCALLRTNSRPEIIYLVATWTLVHYGD